MFAVYLCLVSVLVPLGSSKISLVSFGGKTYLNGRLEVEAPDNGNINDGIVNGHTHGLKLNVIKTLTREERLILGEQLKKSNDLLTQLEEEKVKRLEDRENELEKLLKGEEKEQLNNFINENKVPQKTMSRKNRMIKKRPKQNKITEVKDVEGDSRMMQNDRVVE